MPSIESLTQNDYWSNVWEHTVFRPVDPNHHYDRELIRLFAQAGRLLGQPEVRLLEVGCGNSVWLPYLGKAFGFEVSGLDYSEAGCRLARENLSAEGIAGQIMQRDLFADNSDLSGRYGIVYSAGFIEHFEDPVPVIRTMAEFLAPGGFMVTMIPNLHNFSTIVQRIVGPKTLAVHKFINVGELRRYHSEAGLVSIEATHAGFGGNVTPDRARADDRETRATWGRIVRMAYRPLFFVASRSARLARRALDRFGATLPRGPRVSPAILYLGQKAVPDEG